MATFQPVTPDAEAINAMASQLADTIAENGCALDDVFGRADLVRYIQVGMLAAFDLAVQLQRQAARAATLRAMRDGELQQAADNVVTLFNAIDRKKD